MNRPRNKRIGRNDPCHCGSGNKFKRCHGSIADQAYIGPSDEEIQLRINEVKAHELQRQQQQGLGNPIVGAQFKGYQFVAVGNTVHYGKWKTFVDFLSDYIKNVLGGIWGNDEIAKPLARRHPILQWYDAVCRHQRENMPEVGEVRNMPATGAMAAYFGLAYNLYLLAHNVELQARLLTRLRNSEQFRGAYFETLVAACFVLSGFTLELENEQDGDTTHCEFTATNKSSGNKYSVEAKSRGPGKANADVGNQLYAALTKEANHTRIVLIDINLPNDAEKAIEAWRDDVLSGIAGREGGLTIRGEPAPPAYVLVTNHPYHYDLDGTGTVRAVLGAGFKIPDFGYRVMFASLIEGFKAIRKHADVLAVIDGFRNYSIPTTFDGQAPEFAFHQTEPRYLVGRKYDLSEHRPGAVGELETGVVSGDGRQAHLVMKMEDGTRAIFTNTLTDAEAAAYRAHPSTFFGVEINVGGKVETPMEMFEFFYDSYKNTPREKVLEFLSNAQDLAALSEMTDDDLRLTLCERWVWGSGAFRADGQPART